MKLTAKFQKRRKIPEGRIDALLGLRRALREEAYEQCPFWLAKALRSGLTRTEIRWFIAHPTHPIEEPMGIS